MSKLVWDQAGKRVYEMGVDRGVLYLPNSQGVPWNGLTSVDENAGEVKVTPYFIDGVKYFNDRTVGDLSVSIKAFTYPDEFMPFDGYQSPTLGLFLDGQPVNNTFGLSYRTGLGNDLDGMDHGYKIHILYNLTATPSNRAFDTQNDGPDPVEFSWDVTGVPVAVPGFYPTFHAILDTRFLASYILDEIEGILYGGESTDARLPTLSELISTLSNLNALSIRVVDNGDGTWTATGSDAVVKSLDATSFEIAWPTAQYTDETSYTLSTD